MKMIVLSCEHRSRLNLSIYLQTFMRILIGILTVSLLVSHPAHAASNIKPETSLNFGLLPFLSTKTLVKKFEPMISYLEKTLNRPINVKSAPDFKTYIERATQGEYDLFLAAPHISAYMEKRFQSRRVSRFKRTLKGYFVVHTDSTYKSLSELRGKRFATADQLAVITILGEGELVDNGLDPNKDFVRHYTSHNNAMHLVAQGKQDVAVVGVTIFDNMQAPVKKRLRVLAKTKGIPHMMFHTRRGLSDSDHQAISDAMLRFTASGPGKEFFTKVAYGDMTPINNQDIERLSNLVVLLEQKLKQ